MQYKIVRALNGIVSIASNEGKFFNVPIEELDFDPKAGDEVQCFKNGEKVIVVPKNPRQTTKSVHRESIDNPRPIQSYKIIRVLNGIVSIASGEGDFFNVPIEELDFDPKVGDEVRCFKNGEDVIVFKNGAPPRKLNQTPSPVPKNESPSNLQASAVTTTAPKVEPPQIKRNVPVVNPLAGGIVDKKSKVPWIVGILFLLLGVFVVVLYLHHSSRTLIDSRDGKKYRMVKIGNQIWMAENLSYDTEKGSWCLNDKELNCGKFGRLYTWKAAMNACPSGWHLPSKDEFDVLINEAGGEEIAGQKLKAKEEWYEDGKGTDDFSFSALPAGVMTEKSGYGNGASRILSLFFAENWNYEDGGLSARFWSATEDDSNSAYYMYLYCSSNAAYLYNYNENTGFSVRCIQD